MVELYLSNAHTDSENMLTSIILNEIPRMQSVPEELKSLAIRFLFFIFNIENEPGRYRPIKIS